MQRTLIQALISAIVVCSVTAAIADDSPSSAWDHRHRVDGVSIVVDGAPDCRSLRTIVQSVTQGCKSNDEKAIAIYNFLRLANYHLNYPSEPGGISSLKLINVYGWSLCGGLHTVEASLWREMGWKWRYVGWSNPGHTTVEAFYDGQWHYLDTFLKFYVWKPDSRAPGGRTIASQADILANPSLVTDSLVKDPSRDVYYFRSNPFETINEVANFRAPAFFLCGDTPEGVLLGVRNRKVAGSQTGWNGIKFDTGDYSTDVNLSPGNSLTLTWDTVANGHWWSGKRWTPKHSCGDKEYRNCACIGPILEPYHHTSQARSYANGELRIAPDLNSPGSLQTFVRSSNARLDSGRLVPRTKSEPATVTLEMSSPYILTLARGSATGAEKAEVSVDGGNTFKLVSLRDFSEAVQGHYRALVKLTFTQEMSEIELVGTVQCNRCAIPYLSPGCNEIGVSVDSPSTLGDNELVVTYAYRVGSRRTSYETLADDGYEMSRGHHANWSSEVTVVQKRFRKTDLPATFSIDIPTSKGRYPVYPRMVFLRREIVTPRGEPLPLPEGSVSPSDALSVELVPVPNPFRVGIAKPPKRIVRPTTTRRIVLPIRQVNSKSGQVFENHLLKWKGSGDAWVMLVGGNVELPPRKQIAAARLVLPISDATPQSRTKIGVSRLTSAFTKGEPFGFSNLGGVAASVVIPKQPDGKRNASPRTFSLDVSQSIKQAAASDRPFGGFAIRTIQDRSIDDGWTVRVDIDQSSPIVLELDVFGK